MDDPKTHHILDALADLFLTTPGTPGTPGPGNLASGNTGGSPVAANAHAPATPPTSTTSPQRRTDPLAAPAPLRLPPKLQPTAPSAYQHHASSPTAAHHPHQVNNPHHAQHSASDIIGTIGSPRTPHHTGSATRTDQAFDHHFAQPIDTGLNADDIGDTTHTRTGRLPHLQAVVLGSLPGFAHPWLTQYAHHLSTTLGPVILLRLEPQALTIDLITSPRTAQSEKPLHHAAQRHHPTSPVQAIDHLLHPDSRDVPAARVLLVEAEDVAVLANLHLPRVTLVCGAYESALQDAAQKIRDLLTRLQNRPQTLPDIGLMIMGSDAARAAQAHAQLNALIADLLPEGVQLRGSQQQMVPVRLQPMAHFTHDPQNDRDLRAYLEELASLDQLLPEPVATPSAPATALQPPAPASLPTTVQAPPSMQALSSIHTTPAVAVSANVITTTAPTAVAVESSHVVAEPVSVAATLSEPPTAAPSTPVDHEPDLSALVAPYITGSITLQARCPQHPDMPLLLDELGRLHLITRTDEKPDHLAQAVMGLLETRTWVREHFELLQLTQRQCRFDPTHEPQLHLLAQHAPQAVQLTRRVGSLLRIHLLQHVRVGAASTWVCTPLS